MDGVPSPSVGDRLMGIYCSLTKRARCSADLSPPPTLMQLNCRGVTSHCCNYLAVLIFLFVFARNKLVSSLLGRVIFVR